MGNKQEVALILREYKHLNGAVNFPAIFSGVPTSERIPMLAQKNFMEISMLITGALTVAFESMNFKKPPTASQICDITDAIVDSSAEDNLSMEDLMLFLQNMIRGEYKMSYESIDVPRFMAVFEFFRQIRFEEMIKIRDYGHEQYKSLGDDTRITKRDPLDEHYYTLVGRVHELEEKLREKTVENKILKDPQFGTE